MSRRSPEPDLETADYVDVNTLPLKPPQPLLPPEKPVRRPWHPVMWDSSIIGVPPPDYNKDEVSQPKELEYPHKKRLLNLRRLIKEGKIKPSPENVIFFLCNKFAMSEEKQSKIA